MVSEDARIQSEMSLWWLGHGAGKPGHEPRLIGRLFLTQGNEKVGLEYADDWSAAGFALSDDLPLGKGVYLPVERDMAPGAVNDARPDQWGERVIRAIDRPARQSVLDYLYFAGEDRCGGLGVSKELHRYVPNESMSLPGLESLADMDRAVASVRAGEPLDAGMVRLVRAGSLFGGARPKSLVEMSGSQWLLKFSAGEDFDMELVEHATMRLACHCGIQVASTQALPLRSGHAVAVKRFDRNEGSRSHVISAKTVLHAAGLTMGYPELAQCLHRIARPATVKAHQEELFRRMVFNILMDNTDDHEKNHALLRAADGYYDLSPAYDVVPAVQGLGEQQLRIGAQGTDSTIENALSEAEAFGLTKKAAVGVAKQVAAGVSNWKAFFQSHGVAQKDLAIIAQYIDGRHLEAQRAALVPRT